MKNDVTTQTDASPFLFLLQMMTDYWNSQAIYVAPKLGVSDLLVDGPRQNQSDRRTRGN